jgi:hypothetical protein
MRAGKCDVRPTLATVRLDCRCPLDADCSFVELQALGDSLRDRAHLKLVERAALRNDRLAHGHVQALEEVAVPSSQLEHVFGVDGDPVLEEADVDHGGREEESVPRILAGPLASPRRVEQFQEDQSDLRRVVNAGLELALSLRLLVLVGLGLWLGRAGARVAVDLGMRWQRKQNGARGDRAREDVDPSIPNVACDFGQGGEGGGVIFLREVPVVDCLEQLGARVEPSEKGVGVARHVLLDPLSVHAPVEGILPLGPVGAEKGEHDQVRVAHQVLAGSVPVVEGVTVRFQYLPDLVVQPLADRGLVRSRLVKEFPRVSILKELPENLLGSGFVQSLQHVALGLVTGFPVRNLAVSAAIEGRSALRTLHLPAKQLQATVARRVVRDAWEHLFQYPFFGEGASEHFQRTVPEASSKSTAIFIAIAIEILSPLILSVAHRSRGQDGGSWIECSRPRLHSGRRNDANDKARQKSLLQTCIQI